MVKMDGGALLLPWHLGDLAYTAMVKLKAASPTAAVIACRPKQAIIRLQFTDTLHNDPGSIFFSHLVSRKTISLASGADSDAVLLLIDAG
jgi:hypothetical protein